MNAPTLDELRERYRGMADDQLLVLAAESDGLISGAAALLTEELARRKLSADDVSQTRTSLEQFRARGESVQRALFDPRVKLQAALRQLAAAAAAVAWLLVSSFFANRVFRSRETGARFEAWSCALFALAYIAWQMWAYRRRRGERAQPEATP